MKEKKRPTTQVGYYAPNTEPGKFTKAIGDVSTCWCRETRFAAEWAPSQARVISCYRCKGHSVGVHDMTRLLHVKQDPSMDANAHDSHFRGKTVLSCPTVNDVPTGKG